MNRQQRRAMKKIMGKESSTLIDMMLNMPTDCTDCKAAFDKTNREMVDTWTVSVKYDNQSIELFCPTCRDARVAVREKQEENSVLPNGS